jgi:hypothetical protein
MKTMTEMSILFLASKAEEIGVLLDLVVYESVL